MKRILLVLSILFASSSMVLASSSYDQADISYCASKWGASSGSYRSCIGGRADKTGTHHHASTSRSYSSSSTGGQSSSSPVGVIAVALILFAIPLFGNRNSDAALRKRAEPTKPKEVNPNYAFDAHMAHISELVNDYVEKEYKQIRNGKVEVITKGRMKQISSCYDKER